MSLISELKRRKIVQVAAVYAVVAWLLVQIVATVEAPLNLPDWVDTLVILLLLIGFPITMIISWAFNMTPEGLVRDEGAGESDAMTGRRIEYVLIGLLGLAVIVLLWREFSPEPQEQVAETPVETQTPVLAREPAKSEPALDVLPNSIAVLPFDNLSADPDNAYFAAGIHDMILSELSKIADMNVIARTSMLQYADGQTPITQVAEELNVETVMEGTVQYANGQVRITAQLIDPGTGSHLWSENYDRDFADIFAIQSEIAERIAQALEAELTPAELASIERPKTTSPAAHALFLQARAQIGVGFLGPAAADNRDFQGYLDQAIELDPDFALAHAVKAASLARIAAYADEARFHAEKALQIDPSLGLTHLALAMIHRSSWRIPEAIEEWDLALELSPNHPDILNDAALFYAQLGDLDTASRLMERYAQLVDTVSGIGYQGWAALLGGDFDTAAAAYRQLEERGEISSFINYGFVEAVRGNFANALSLLAIAEEFYSEDSLSTFEVARVTDTYTRMGRHEDAQRWYDRFQVQAQNEKAELNTIIYAHVAIGDAEQALAGLQYIAENQPPGAWNFAKAIASNRLQHPMLEQPEFIEVRERLGAMTE